MKICIVFIVTACKKGGPIQQMLNIIKNLDRSKFTPVLLTIYPEPTDGTSQLLQYLKSGVIHYHVPTSKIDILLGRLTPLEKVLNDLKPEVIHSLGVFPDYAIFRLGYSNKQVITLRNYMWEDYPSKFGYMKGNLLVRLQMRAVKKAAYVVACSQSLSRIYQKRRSLSFNYIRNGIDLNQYHSVSAVEKAILRQKLNLSKEKKIFVYSGQFIPRKNQGVLLKVFTETPQLDETVLLLLGNGPDFDTLKQKYGDSKRVILRGMVTNVNEYLQASDVYISSSLSEGMPNGVLEAMASGLPVILSDIPQHKELFECSSNIGVLFDVNDESDCVKAIEKILHSEVLTLGAAAEECAKFNFGADKMSGEYQKIYEFVGTKSM